MLTKVAAAPTRTDSTTRPALALTVTLLAFQLLACGSKTGLTVPERDAGPVTDAGICIRSRSLTEQRTPEILFVLDKSRSMEFNLAGNPAGPGEPRRWDLLGDALLDALQARESELGFGVLLFPDAVEPIRQIQDACEVSSSLSLGIGPANLGRLERLFQDEEPLGGTPTAGALRTARDLLGTPRRGVQRFVVLATDGAPNCNGEPPTPPPACLCTSDDREVCGDPIIGPFQCLDDSAAVDAVASLSMEDGVPVFVIGIDDPRRPEFAATLDAMAVAGTRPRAVGGRRFYDVSRPADLEEALETITSSIEECVFYLTSSLPPDEIESVELDGVPLPRDENRLNGWAITNQAAGEISFFGRTCGRLALSDAAPVALGGCP